MVVRVVVVVQVVVSSMAMGNDITARRCNVINEAVRRLERAERDWSQQQRAARAISGRTALFLAPAAVGVSLAEVGGRERFAGARFGRCAGLEGRIA